MATTGELYSVFEGGPLQDRQKLEISIANTPAHKSALQLLLLWRPNLASGKPVPAPEPILDDTWPRGIDPSPHSPPPEPPPAQRPVSPGWVALSEFNPPSRSPCPVAIRFWDGSEQSLEYWYEILIGVVKRLHSEGRLAVEDVPIGWTSKVYSVHTKPVHPSGKEFKSPKWVEGTPFVVNVHLDPRYVRENTRKLLQRCGRSPADVHLRATQ